MILAPFFQPITQVVTGRFVAAEVLSRWYRAGIILAPLDIKPCVDWAEIDISVAEFLYTFKDKCGFKRFFMNVSAQTLGSDVNFHTWSRAIKALVKQGEIRIVIEVTENIPDQLLEKRWQQLLALGVELALDDYGDQYSTLKRLTSYPWK